MKSVLSSNSLSRALRLVMAGSLVLVASACAVEQKCPLGTNDHYCTTVKDTYEAARSGGGSKDNVNQPVGNGKKGMPIGWIWQLVGTTWLDRCTTLGNRTASGSPRGRTLTELSIAARCCISRLQLASTTGRLIFLVRRRA